MISPHDAIGESKKKALPGSGFQAPNLTATLAVRLQEAIPPKRNESCVTRESNGLQWVQYLSNFPLLVVKKNVALTAFIAIDPLCVYRSSGRALAERHNG